MSDILRIKEISNYEQFRDMKDAWSDLIVSSNVDNIFLTHEWMDLYIKNCCNGDRLIILAVFNGDTLVGVAPLMIRRCIFMGGSVKSVCFIGTSASDRMDFILLEPKEKYVLPIMDYLMGINRNWDILDFQEIEKSSGTVEMIEKWAGLREIKFILDPWERTFFIKLDCNADFLLKRISKKLHRKMKKLSKKNKAHLEFRRYTDNEAKGSLFYGIQAIAKHSWKGMRQKSVFLKENIRDFHRDIFFRFAMSRYLDISILRMDNMPIAYIYNFLYNSRLYNYSVEFDSRCSHISAGTMLMLWSIEDAASRGIKEIDFGRGEDGWKSRLTQDFRMHARVRIFNNSFYGKCLYLLCSGLKCIKANIKKKSCVYRILRNLKQSFL